MGNKENCWQGWQKQKLFVNPEIILSLPFLCTKIVEIIPVYLEHYILQWIYFDIQSFLPEVNSTAVAASFKRLPSNVVRRAYGRSVFEDLLSASFYNLRLIFDRFSQI
jgi:hypothetical protein